MKPFFKKAIGTFLIAAIATAVVSYLGSLFLHDELRMNWIIILLVALVAALISYLSSLRNYVAELEGRIEKLEYQIKH